MESTNGKMDFTIGGRKVSLNKKMVENALRHVEPETIKKYWVRIGSRDYPIKQALATASGVPGIAFISADAFRILTRLGFEVKA